MIDADLSALSSGSVVVLIGGSSRGLVLVWCFAWFIRSKRRGWVCLFYMQSVVALMLMDLRRHLRRHLLLSWVTRAGY